MFRINNFLSIAGISGSIATFHYYVDHENYYFRVRQNSSLFLESKILLAKAQEVENFEKVKYDIQLIHTKEKEALQQQIRELKRKLLLRQRNEQKREKKLKKSLIAMYGDVVDELETFKNDFAIENRYISYDTLFKDELPRVVVVGEQSAGKTSVLELIVGARLFPRGSGVMKTRTPIKVTLAEGPYRYAQFDNTRENGTFAGQKYDLSEVQGEINLRKDIETQMEALAYQKTVSKSPVSLSVHGPGLKRMVLVDLPGIINTVTTGMHLDAKDSVREMVNIYMSNPNAIILCIQDGSKDAETSSIVDLVSAMDPRGKRTIFVLTKLDRAVKQMEDPSRIHQILQGKVFKMKALGYFAVIAGTNDPKASLEEVKRYERNFFNDCVLFKDKPLPEDKITTDSLTTAVSIKFWKLVEESIEHQCDIFRALRFNLETEWKHKFQGKREQDRYELFEKARSEILDNLIFFNTNTKEWEDMLRRELWGQLEDRVFESIVMPTEDENPTDSTKHQVNVDIKLKKWANEELSRETVKVGHAIFMDQLKWNEEKNSKKTDDWELFQKFKNTVFENAFRVYRWDGRGQNALNVVQMNALDNTVIKDEEEWREAIEFMKTTLQSQIQKFEDRLNDLKGPGVFTSWFTWTSQTLVQKNRRSVIAVLKEVLRDEPMHSSHLSSEELIAIRRHLQLQKIDVDSQFIKETWNLLYRHHYYTLSYSRAKQAANSFYQYKQTNENRTNLYDDSSLTDVIFYWRLVCMLRVSAYFLMQQISENEKRRFERIMNNELNEIFADDCKMEELFSGERVKLAEDLRNIRRIQEKLEEFKEALKSSK